MNRQLLTTAPLYRYLNRKNLYDRIWEKMSDFGSNISTTKLYQIRILKLVGELDDIIWIELRLFILIINWCVKTDVLSSCSPLVQWEVRVLLLLWTVETKIKLNWEFLFCLLSGFNESRSRCCLRSHSFHFPLSPRHTLSLYLSLSKHWIMGVFFSLRSTTLKTQSEAGVEAENNAWQKTLWQFAVIQRSNSCQSALSAK